MMPENKSKTITTMQKIMYTAGVLAAIAGGITGFKTIKSSISEYVHIEVHKAIEHDVRRFEDTIQGLSIKLEDHIKQRSSSFAIGLRYNVNLRHLVYKAEDSNEYPAYKDIQMSNAYNYPYYYYIKPTTGEKTWCK